MTFPSDGSPALAGGIADTHTRRALLGIDVELPDGTTVTCRPLTLPAAVEFMELLEKARTGDLKATRRILTEFPKAVGAAKAFEAFTPGELLDVLMDFFAARRRKQPAPATSPTIETPPTPAPSSTS